MKRAHGDTHAGGPGEKRSNDGATVPPPLYQPSLKFRLELGIDNLNEFLDDGDDVDGPVVTAEDDSFAVFLKCKSPGSWRLMMDCTARVVGSSAQKVQRGAKMSERNRSMRVLSEKKQVLLDPANDYLAEGTFKMDVDVAIYEPYHMLVDFFTSDSNYDADVVLRVQDRRFHVNKAVSTRKNP
ncbi:hypothetical protein AAVH_21507 [Aphelenchoides avenae]|nr:hypothetical protein AAVH_21507 [Aphelenchus avenae]